MNVLVMVDKERLTSAIPPGRLSCTSALVSYNKLKFKLLDHQHQ
jgi:hypothetical protein